MKNILRTLSPKYELKERLEQFFDNVGLVKSEKGRARFKPEIARMIKTAYGWHLIVGLYPGISLDSLRKHRSALEYAAEGEVIVYQDNSNWLHIKVFTRNLPKKISYMNYLIERARKYPLAIPAGISRQGIEWIKLFKDDEFSLFVPGESGGGKSTFLRQALLTSVMAYSPAQLNLYLGDLKDGNEFNIFSQCPHTKAYGEDMDGVRTVIAKVKAEYKRRARLYKEVGCEPKIDSYNKVARRKLPRIMFAIDETADLAGSTKSTLTPEQMDIVEITRKGRAYGISTIISVQKPTAEQLPTAIRFNLVTTVCFKMQNELNSTLALGRDYPYAAFIKTPGRAFIQKGFTKEIQVPFLGYELAKSMIKAKYPVQSKDISLVQKFIP